LSDYWSIVDDGIVCGALEIGIPIEDLEVEIWVLERE
jgi:hypothetical protein